MAKVKPIERPETKPPLPVSKESLASQAGVTTRRTRKRKEKEPEPIVKIDPAAVKVTLCTPFDVIARVRRYDGWKLTDEEADKLTEAWVPVFDKWVAPHAGDYFILIAAFLATIGAVTNKAAEERDYREKEAKRSPAPEVTTISGQKTV